jgi:hypothetical protein
VDALEVIEGVKVVRGKLAVGGAKCFKLMPPRNTINLSKDCTVAEAMEGPLHIS